MTKNNNNNLKHKTKSYQPKLEFQKIQKKYKPKAEMEENKKSTKKLWERERERDRERERTNFFVRKNYAKNESENDKFIVRRSE